MKKNFGKMVTFAFALASVMSVSLYADNEEHYKNSKTMEKNMTAEKNIVEIAQSNSDFSTLVKALVAANLVSVLEGQGPFTVFAPTNAAFAKLPAGTLENLLKPENKAKLAAILTYHVVSGKVLAADVKTMKAKTVNGKDLDIKVNGSNVNVNEDNEGIKEEEKENLKLTKEEINELISKLEIKEELINEKELEWIKRGDNSFIEPPKGEANFILFEMIKIFLFSI